MPGRPLPNYDDYLDKLKCYIKACELTLEYRDEPCDGVWIPARRTIAIDKDLQESTEIAIILHELGHSLDDAMASPKVANAYSRAYTAFYANRLTKKQRQHILTCEQTAWNNGRALATRLRIPLGKWFSDEEAACLKSFL